MLYVHEVKNNKEKYCKKHGVLNEYFNKYFTDSLNSMIIDSGEAGEIADWLCIDDPSSCLLSEILHNIRLPFKNCIIEYFLSELGQDNNGKLFSTGKKCKCFSMCEEEENIDGTFSLRIFTFVKYILQGLEFEHIFARSEIIVNKKGEIISNEKEQVFYANLISSDFMQAINNSPIVISKEKIEDDIRGINNSLIWRLLYVIYLINCKNVTIEKHVIDEKLKKKHLSKRGFKIDDYHIVKIHQSNKVRKGETRGEYHVRLHMCRGHFKQVNNLFGRGISGTYWWNPFTRGKKELGEIKKEYVY